MDILLRTQNERGSAGRKLDEGWQVIDKLSVQVTFSIAKKEQKFIQE